MCIYNVNYAPVLSNVLWNILIFNFRLYCATFILEELSVRLDTLLELLSEKGIVSKKEYTSNVMMRLHETSKAKGFEELDEEI